MNLLKTLGLLALVTLCRAVAAPTLDLSGDWQVSLQQPAAPTASWQSIRLPGTLTDAGIGTPLENKPELNMATLAHLQAKFRHIGPAWYRREVVIPAEWAGRRVVLDLERVLWESAVWVDGRYAGRANSLVAPHIHDLSAWLPPGRHELLVRIDNREIHPGLSHRAKEYADAADSYLAHAYTNHTQTIWNGMLGTLRLRAEEPAALERLAVFPRREPTPALRLEGTFATPPASGAGAALHFALRRADGSIVAERDENLGADGAAKFAFEWVLPAGADVQPWSEFSPALYRLEVTAAGSSAAPSAVRFGFREIVAEDGELRLDGHRISLRGTLDCAAFPLTGYPPTDVESWRKIFGRAREWGLNHLRFHSWCPPEAAFDAADELGMYLQIELPHWSLAVGKNPETWAFLQAEAERMLAAYGNHPSFLLLSLGNELQGDMSALDALVRQLRQRDGRRLYTATTFTFEPGHGRAPAPDDQFFVTQQTNDGWVRGQGIFDEQPPAFDVDYHAAAKGIRVPLVTHEIGQYAIYPDLREIERYTGNLVPQNLIAIRDDLARKGLLALAPQFTEASGRFAALLYKEEIERALRTPEIDGFQLLGLQDFPGQGTAHVGLLNVFWEPKGILSAERFREFCGPVVPLARFSKAIHERGEVFRAELQLANFERDLRSAQLSWLIRNGAGVVLAKGGCGPLDSPAGAVTTGGEIAVPIPAEGGAERWELEVSLAGREVLNRWNLWIYPASRAAAVESGRVVTSLEEALRALGAGERVLFNPPIDQIAGIPGRFVPVFWSPVHFPDQPGTMGLLCDPAHPALRKFPTEAHSDWQWWELALHSKSVVLDGLAVAPIVRVIDNFKRNHSLANVFETRVGEGRLLFCGIDVTNGLERRPVARQLRASLLGYLDSDEFEPSGQISPEQLAAIVGKARSVAPE
ncbi:MAG TPA: hypothetical protein VK178_08385 [Opitutaceae bacterium]|nr:hypothetical protein [Opitutaceae bacterium]